MENLGKDFRDYATKHLGLNGLTTDDVMSHQVDASLTPMILEERELRVTQMSVFDRLMMDRILWISGGVDSRMASVVQAQLMFLDSVDKKKDITMHLDTPGGSVLSGLGIRDVMNHVSCDIATINTGMCASMGSILISSGTQGTIGRSNESTDDPCNILPSLTSTNKARTLSTNSIALSMNSSSTYLLHMIILIIFIQ